jgi:prepilin-type processing-associated H-X9-DG protein
MINGHWAGYSSDHPSGVQIAMCDGSVRFLEETVQIFSLGSLIQIQDGNIVPEEI